MQCLPQYKFPISLDSSLDLSRRKSLKKNTFCKASKYKSQLHFPSHNNRTCTKRTYKQQSTLLPRRN